MNAKDLASFSCIKRAIKCSAVFELATPLLLRTGDAEGEVDNTLDVTPDGKLCVNGYVWSSLFRRAFRRLERFHKLAGEVGKYGDSKKGVSPFWFHISLVDVPGKDVRPGIVINRKTGAPEKGLLYAEEVAITGLRIPFSVTIFPDLLEDSSLPLKEAFREALWVIEKGVENIGGGWGYGFGRLKLCEARWSEFNFGGNGENFFIHDGHLQERGELLTLPEEVSVREGWVSWDVDMRIVPGQLLAVHSDDPTLAVSSVVWDKYPDSFVFRRLRFFHDRNTLEPEPFIPGKAIRQAIFSTHIERRLKTEGHNCCDPTSENSKSKNKKDCKCLRCLWFGSTYGSGIIAVLDAPIKNPEFEVVQRVQLCEHSFQNMNLFSEEFLKGGNWTTRIILDKSRTDTNSEELKMYVESILEEMKPGKSPSGWFRIGSHSTCTGQIEVREVKKWEK